MESLDKSMLLGLTGVLLLKEQFVLGLVNL